MRAGGVVLGVGERFFEIDGRRVQAPGLAAHVAARTVEAAADIGQRQTHVGLGVATDDGLGATEILDIFTFFKVAAFHQNNTDTRRHQFARGMMVETMKTMGADSFAGRLSCVIQGSTETTFYVLAVYFGSVGVKKTRHALACALAAEMVGVLAAIRVTYLFFG